MDPTTAIRTDTLSAIATVVAPGACASAPYIWALSSPQNLLTFTDHHEAVAVAAGLIVCVTAGLFVESAGSYVEYYLIDKRKKNHEQLVEQWWRFLRTSWQVEPVGLRYLRRILVSFKFELNLSVAAFFTLPGIIILWGRGALKAPWAIVSMVLSLVVSGVMFAFARTSASVLAEVREQLLRKPEDVTT